MAQHQTGISINENVYRQAKRFAQSQRPSWNFSALVEIALEDFLAAQGQPIKKESGMVKDASNTELAQAA